MNRYKQFQNIVFLAQISLNIALPIVGGLYLGAYLDRKFNSGNAFLILGLIAGFILGIGTIYRLASHEADKNKK
ncbi:MAG TPA: AtpZ/AtpI family protein [Thermoanaerobacterales bacterium]|jgi:ATP synthase protein I|nr:AtpZ/AtpI family protein [Thermoanaerobacterales bacterium]